MWRLDDYTPVGVLATNTSPKPLLVRLVLPKLAAAAGCATAMCVSWKPGAPGASSYLAPRALAYLGELPAGIGHHATARWPAFCVILKPGGIFATVDLGPVDSYLQRAVLEQLQQLMGIQRSSRWLDYAELEPFLSRHLTDLQVMQVKDIVMIMGKKAAVEEMPPSKPTPSSHREQINDNRPRVLPNG